MKNYIAVIIFAAGFVFLGIFLSHEQQNERADAAFATRTPYVAGDPILASDVNTNESNIFNQFNGNIETANIADGTILGADMNCAGTEWATLTACDSSVDDANLLHTHDMSGVSFTDSGSYFSTDTVEAALNEIGSFTGMGSGTSTYAVAYMRWDASGNATGTVSYDLSPAQTTGLSGVMFDVSSYLYANGNPGGPAGSGRAEIWGTIATSTFSNVLALWSDADVNYANVAASIDYNFASETFTPGATLSVLFYYVDADTGTGSSSATRTRVKATGYK